MEEMNIPQDTVQDTTPELAEAPKKKGSARKVLYFVLLAVFIGVFAFSAIYIANYMVDSHQQGNQYADLEALRNQYLNSLTDPDKTLPTGGSAGTGDVGSSGGILPELQELFSKNKDLVGWIEIPGTKVNYPVMQTPDRPNYYLYRNFEQKDSRWGSLYVREVCDVFTPCDNVVIYGHHMQDGSMFADLMKYQRKSFWEEHQTFSFDTLYERHTYQVIAVFKTSANIGEGFSYHTFNTAANEKEFNDFMKQVHRLQYYKTGITAEYGDVLLTLSTCEYTLDNGRFVVVAKRIS